MRSFIFKLLLVLAAPVLALVVLELGLRIFQTGRLYLVESSPHYIDEIGFALKPNFKGWWHGARYEINANGFRMPEDIQTTTNRLRILALGDSVTEGYCVTDVEDVWPMRLQSRLNTSNESAYVVNSGVAAWNLIDAGSTNIMESGQFYRFLTGDAALYDPDVIIYCICMNDFPGRVNNLFEAENKQNKKRFKLFPEEWRGFLKRKAFYRLARDWYREQKFFTLDFSSIPTPDQSEEYWQRITDELAALQKAATGMDAKFACIIWPYSYQVLPANQDLKIINERLKQSMSALSIPYRDMLDQLNTTNVLSNYVLGDYIHPNAQGQDLIARAAAELISEISPSTHEAP